MNDSLPEKIPFNKLSASANDFIVIDDRDAIYGEAAGWLAQRVCARRFSVGADGLILIQRSPKATFRVRFFNPDGNEFSTCGNGGRAAARFAHANQIADEEMTIETNVGIIDAKMNGNKVKLKFVAPSEIRLDRRLEVDGKEIKGDYVRLGDPHFVVRWQNIRGIPFAVIARKIRQHQALAPDGANVHFIEPVSRQVLKIRSFERGVEDETLACGSGCISSAIATFSHGEAEPPITFQPQSGIPVSVHFQAEKNFRDMYLEGDARIVYSGEFTKEALNGFPIPQR